MEINQPNNHQQDTGPQLVSYYSQIPSKQRKQIVEKLHRHIKKYLPHYKKKIHQYTPELLEALRRLFELFNTNQVFKAQQTKSSYGHWFIVILFRWLERQDPTLALVVEFRDKFLQEDLRPSWELLADQEKLELDQKNRWRAVLEFVLFAVNNSRNSSDLNKKINGNGNGVFNAKKKIRRLGWGEASQDLKWPPSKIAIIPIEYNGILGHINNEVNSDNQEQQVGNSPKMIKNTYEELSQQLMNYIDHYYEAWTSIEELRRPYFDKMFPSISHNFIAQIKQKQLPSQILNSEIIEMFTDYCREHEVIQRTTYEVAWKVNRRQLIIGELADFLEDPEEKITRINNILQRLESQRHQL